MGEHPRRPPNLPDAAAAASARAAGIAALSSIFGSITVSRSGEIALLATLVLLFGFQDGQIVRQPLIIALLAGVDRSCSGRHPKPLPEDDIRELQAAAA